MEEKTQDEKHAEFIEASRPLMKWLAENRTPHTKAIVSPVSAELFSGEMSTGLMLDYLREDS